MSDSVQPHRRQPTRLPRPWDSPGKNTRVGCHFLLQCMKVKSESEVVQLCPALCDPMECSLPGSSIHGIFQARVLEWGAIAFSSIALVKLNYKISQWHGPTSFSFLQLVLSGPSLAWWHAFNILHNQGSPKGYHNKYYVYSMKSFNFNNSYMVWKFKKETQKLSVSYKPSAEDLNIWVFVWYAFLEIRQLVLGYSNSRSQDVSECKSNWDTPWLWASTVQ